MTRLGRCWKVDGDSLASQSTGSRDKDRACHAVKWAVLAIHVMATICSKAACAYIISVSVVLASLMGSWDPSFGQEPTA